MAHEKSATVRGGEIGKTKSKWYVIDTVGSNKGKILGNHHGYATEKKATAYAKNRSRYQGTKLGRFFK